MAEQNEPVRIWYQSFIDVEAQAPYFRRLQAYIDRIKVQSTTVDIHGISPPDRYFHPITEFRGARQTIRNALRARDEGYDAFVIGHFPEPGLQECRGAIDIPVLGLGEATLLYGCMLGRKIGLITINPVFVPYIEAQVIAHGLQQRVAGVTAIDADVARFMEAFENADVQQEIRREFEAHVAPMVSAGADVIIPSGGMPMLLFSQMQPFTIKGAAVLEGIGAVLKMAEMAVAVHRITGVAAGRSGQFHLASNEAIKDFLAS
jgi:Asp/Glu/hydantoin racemase